MLSWRTYRTPNRWDEMARMNREMSRLLSSSSTANECCPSVFPPVNVYDDGESYVVRAEIPGIDPADLDIRATADSVVIKGERKPNETTQETSYRRRERDHGVFNRSLSLPHPINPDKVMAKYELGVLQVILPKTEDSKPRKVAIN